MSEEMVLRGRYLFPVSDQPLEDGTITIRDGKIAAVKPKRDQSADLDLGNVAILPGFVNAHTHLDLSGLCGQIPPQSDFTQWLQSVISHRRTVTLEATQEAISFGIQESIRFGTTLLGDISSTGLSRNQLAQASLHSICFRELLGLTSERALSAQESANQWLSEKTELGNCQSGLSPHAPYSVRSSLFQWAGKQAVPITIHVAESTAEMELIQHKSGPFVPFLQAVNVWDPDGLISYFDDLIPMYPGPAPLLLAHGNYLSMNGPLPLHATIVYCPRTHASFQHTSHPFETWIHQGHRIVLGTDSLASNPDLDMLQEARFLHQQRPDFPMSYLLRMITLSAAEALGFGTITGSLSEGKSADLVVIPLSNNTYSDPHMLLFDEELPLSERLSLFRGEWRKQPLDFS